MTQLNCPVCGNAGLGDYTTTPLNCPQCKSDLKAFLLLKTISVPKRSSHNLVVIRLSLLALLFCILYFNTNNKNQQLILTQNSIQDSLKLSSSIAIPEQKISHLNESKQNETFIKYKVKKGDCLSKIATFFFNDWRKFKEIETDNNLRKPYILKVGQTLTIKIKQ